MDEIKQKRVGMLGAEAAAFAMKQIEPDVFSAYPITPQTPIIQTFSKYVSNGEVSTEFVLTESEHSAMSVVVGAASAGARATTATASAGFALMWEIIYITAGLQLPVVMNVANRSISAPINIHCDHSDSMGGRDAGWVQIYCENAQEVYDQNIMAYRIAEKARLPVMIMQDGFITSHGFETLNVLEKQDVKKFVGEKQTKRKLLDFENPRAMGIFSIQNSGFEFKRQTEEKIRNAQAVIDEVYEEYEKLTGRKYSAIEEYKTQDADYVMVVLSSTAGTAKDVVDELREKGKKVGLVKPIVFRPFPVKQIRTALKNKKVVAVLDRSPANGALNAPLATEIKTALYNLPDSERPKIVNYIFGLGGRDILPIHLKQVFDELEENGDDEKIRYLNLKE